jgi:hypothetical protein
MAMSSIWNDRLAEIWAPPSTSSPGVSGSGIVIGLRGVLTARHVIKSVASGESRDSVWARVRLPEPRAEQTWVPMSIAYEDKAWDLAVLQVQNDTPEAGAWVQPASKSPVAITTDGSCLFNCESVGFPAANSERPDPRNPDVHVRQSEHTIGNLLPRGYMGPQDLSPSTRPRRWFPMDVTSDIPDHYSQWSGMSGAGVVLSDGRLIGVVVCADEGRQTKRLFVVPLAEALAQSASFMKAMADTAGEPLIVEMRQAPTYRRLFYDGTLRKDGTPRYVKEINDLGELGVKRIDVETDPHYLPYVPRDDDQELIKRLHETVRERQMLLIVGGSASGKSRSAAHAVCEAYPDRRLLRPRENSLAEIVNNLALINWDPAVVWLDDVERYPDLPETLDRLLGIGSLALIGTIRRTVLEELTSPACRSPLKILSDQRKVQWVQWKGQWSSFELDRAANLVRNPLAQRAVRQGVSLSEWAVAGPDLITKLRVAYGDDNRPCRYALVRVVLDWHRTGLTCPIPQSIAASLVRNTYLPNVPATNDDMTDAERWATESVSVGGRRSCHSLLTRQQGGWKAHEYVEDNDRQMCKHDLPEAIWSFAISHATNAPNYDSLWRIVFTAHSMGQADIEQRAVETLVSSGDTNAESYRIGMGDDPLPFSTQTHEAHINEAASFMWDAMGKRPSDGDVNAGGVRETAKKYVVSLTELATKVSTPLESVIKELTPDQYYLRVRDLAHAISTHASQQSTTSPEADWVTAEIHVQAMLEGTTRAAPNLQAVHSFVGKILNLSSEKYLQFIEEDAYYRWKRTGMTWSATLEYWLESEREVLSKIRECFSSITEYFPFST